MSMNWIQNQATKADPSKDIAILEDPDTKEHLDNLLAVMFAPRIWQLLNATSYNVLPAKPEIKSELSYALVRKLDFMLFDYHDFSFFRGLFTVKRDGWMFERTFSLGLPRTTKPEYLFRMLSDPRFSGMPPTLEIMDSDTHPEWDTYYIISFKAGMGTSWGSGDVEDRAITSLKAVIDASQSMYNMAMADRLETKIDVDKFLKVATIGYGAS